MDLVPVAPDFVPWAVASVFGARRAARRSASRTLPCSSGSVEPVRVLLVLDNFTSMVLAAVAPFRQGSLLPGDAPMQPSLATSRQRL